MTDVTNGQDSAAEVPSAVPAPSRYDRVVAALRTLNSMADNYVNSIKGSDEEDEALATQSDAEGVLWDFIHEAFREPYPVGYQLLQNGKWAETSHFVAYGFSSKISPECREVYLRPSWLVESIETAQ